MKLWGSISLSNNSYSKLTWGTDYIKDTTCPANSKQTYKLPLSFDK